MWDEFKRWHSVPLARVRKHGRRKQEDRWRQPSPEGRWRPHGDSGLLDHLRNFEFAVLGQAKAA
jgi:hypothetical protein